LNSFHRENAQHWIAVAGGYRRCTISVALAGGMLITLLGAWGALRIVNRWR
jgi:hypothetical protein